MESFPSRKGLALKKPDKVVYVTSDVQKLKEGNSDIYDNAADDFHTKIRKAYTKFFQGYQIQNNCIIFNNDFNKSPEENADILLKDLKE